MIGGTDHGTARRMTGRWLAGVLLTVLAVATVRAAEPTIAKCQDARGQWHYGDHAAEECGRSVVTELDPQGRKVGEELPPPTAAELAAEDARRAAAQSQAEAERQRQELDRRLLAAYDSDDAIVAARDRRIAGIDSEIRVSQTAIGEISANLDELAGRLQDASGERQARLTRRIGDLESQLRRHAEIVAEKNAEKQHVADQYQTLLQRYRELTGGD